MRKRSIPLLTLLCFILAMSAPFSAAETIPATLAGTDISNGLRGLNFDESWKFTRSDPSGAQNTTYNDSSWTSLNLPYDWSITLAYNQSSPSGAAGGYLDGGVGWYRKTFTIPSEYSGKRVFIDFDGVYMNSQVYINGTSLGTRPYGYVSFEYELTSYLIYGGTNVIAVRVNNNQPTSRWYSGSGIYRNVWLTVLDPVHVDYCGLFVTTPSVSTSSATVNVSALVKNQGTAAKSTYLTTTIYNASGSTVTSNNSSTVNIGASGSNTFSQSLTVSNPSLWSGSSPYLYTLKTEVIVNSVVVDTFRTVLGLRYYSFNANSGFSLNGTAMKLKGVCMHQDLGSLGVAVNYRAFERQLQILKDMGCNAIRTAHNPPDPAVLDICDRLGLLVFDETFDCWETGKVSNDYHLYFSSWAQTDIKAMVRRDRNHPSVIMWSIGNEINSPTVATATNLINWVKAVDSTRPITWANNNMGGGTQQSIGDLLDLVGYNYNTGLYDSHHSSHPAWKMFGSEVCAARRSRGVYVSPHDTEYGNLSPDIGSSYDNSYSATSNATSAENDWKLHNSLSYIAGEFIWTGFDYLGENDWPTKSNNDGIIDTCGFPKDIYYYYQSQWTTAPMVHVLPHWNWGVGETYMSAPDGVTIQTNTITGIFTAPVFVYSNCDSVELFLNGSSLGSQNYVSGGHFEWHVPFAAGTLRAEGKRSGSIVATEEVKTAGAPAKVVLSVDRSTINADRQDLAFITADIVDANGVFAPRAGNTVNFSISGPGMIVGVDNGDSQNHDMYKATSRKAFNGKCLAIAQATKISGSIVITASASGLTGSSVTVTSTGGGTPAPTPTPGPTATPTPSGSNIAQGKTASTDSSETANPPANGNDGNTTTRWCAANGNFNHWWKVDLGSSYSLTGSEVMWEKNSNYTYLVDVSTDNTNWTNKVNRTGSGQTNTDSFTATARYVRITVTGSSSGWASFFEFRVFGSGGGATPTPTPTPTVGPTPTPSGGVIFYQNADYGGTASQTFAKGTYTMAQLNAKGCPNDWMSSLKVPSGWTVIVYQNDNFTGTSWTFTADTTYVGSACNDQMTSCKIQ